MLVTTIDALGHFLIRIITAQWEGMGDVGSARYELALLPPCPTISLLSYRNCQRSPHSSSGPSSLSVKRGQGIWPLNPGLDDQYKLVFTLYRTGCLGVSGTQ